MNRSPLQHTRIAALFLIALLPGCSSCGKQEPAPEASLDTQERPVRPLLALNCGAPGAMESQHPVRTEWLPAVSRDGRQIALAASTEDGARGATNLKLLVLDLDEDTVAHEQVILNPDEGWVCGQLDEAIRDRINDANAWLGDRSWPPMIPLQPEEGRGARGAHMAWAADPDGPFVTWREPALTVVSLQLGHLSRVERLLPSWESHTGRLDPDDGELCHQPSYLGGAWINLAQRALLTRLYFTGNDACWEHDSRFHALRLPEPVNASTVCSTLGGRCAPSCDDPDDLNPRDDACATAGGICCVPRDAVVPCTRLGASCADSCAEGVAPLHQPGCEAPQLCCPAPPGGQDDTAEAPP